MTNLDKIIEPTAFESWKDDCDTGKLKQQIKDLMQELVGPEIDNDDSQVASYKDELRKAINEL
jgi:hypothetical protein